MPMEPFHAGAAALDNGRARSPRARRWFHVTLSGVLLLFVVLGFSRSFFLRPVFTDRPLPAYLYVHGGVLTTWFALSLVQSWLVAARKVAVHRQLGVAAAGVAAVLVPLSAFVATRAIPRYIAGGVDPAEIQFIVIGDLISLVVFSGLVATALLWRRHAEWHRRFMLVASIMIIGPAVARLAQVGIPVPVPVVLLGLLAALGVNDTIRLGRVHRATAVSVSIVLVALTALFLVVGTHTGATLIQLLNPQR